MTIYKDVPVVILTDKPHTHKVGGNPCRCTTPDFADIPVAVFNEGTGRVEHVVNNRGFSLRAAE